MGDWSLGEGDGTGECDLGEGVVGEGAYMPCVGEGDLERVGESILTVSIGLAKV